jgi:trehalose 6-phosphate synthase
VSNRLPVALKQVDGQWKAFGGSGGLVSAMAPVLRDRGGTWVGWSGAADVPNAGELLANFSSKAGYELQPVDLTEQEVQEFYFGFANEVVWPLFHDFQSRANFKPEYWHTYVEVNRKFAEQVAEASSENDYIWVHDYHLMHVAWWLRKMGVKRRTGFFLHIPFPPPDIYVKMPWRDKLIKALMEFDLAGFHTMQDRRNFQSCVKMFSQNSKIRGRGPVVTLTKDEGAMQVGAFPISIDYKNFQDTARKKSVAKQSREIQSHLQKRKLILGVDRLDYTKGIPQRLEAMRRALETYPELQGKISLIQVVVPSREKVPEYQALKEEIERLVGEINGQFSAPGYIPIHYHYRSLPREQLVAYYRAAAMALITPLRDGMNLVAKEYCACNVGLGGVLFLSEFAGAAAHLQSGAVLVNPYDVEGVASAIHRAFSMDAKEKRERMKRMRAHVRKYDIFWWVDSFLQAAFGRKLGDFPPMEGVDFLAVDEGEEL